MPSREDSVITRTRSPSPSRSPPTAAEDDSDYQAPARLRYAARKPARPRARASLRPRKCTQSPTHSHPDEAGLDGLEDDESLDEPDEDDIEDARASAWPRLFSPKSTGLCCSVQRLTSLQFRSSGRRDRPGRTQIDHDVFEGLPVRQWKQADAPVGPPPEIKPVIGKNPQWPELPMPRDWQMLPEVSQQLLRAARAGKLYKPPTPPIDEEEKDADEETDAGPVKDSPKGFVIRKWSQVPRHMETPERDYLAKRRKGLSSTYATASGLPSHAAQIGATRMTKVQRTDADGNVVIYEVQALEGQPIEGEVVEEAAAAAGPIIATVAPGTLIEGVGIANADGLVVAATEIVQPTPARRKPPPPPRRRRNKGPGRGYKKVVVVEPGSKGAGPGQNTSVGGIELATPGALGERTTPGEGDIPMPDARDGDGQESGEEGEEGEEDEGSEEGELAQTPTPDRSLTPPQTLPPAPTSAPTSVPTLPLGDSISVPEANPPNQAAAAPASPPPTDPVSAPLEFVPPEQSSSQLLADAMETSAKRPPDQDRSSSPDEPLASATTHSRHGSLSQAAPSTVPPDASLHNEATVEGEVDLFGSLEKHLESQVPPKSED